MSVATSTSNKPLTSVYGTAELTDSTWLTEFEFRHAAYGPLAVAARQGDVSAFSQALPRAYEDLCHIGKRERIRMLEALSTLWKCSASRGYGEIPEGSLAHCLFDRDLTQDEFSGRVEAIMTSAGTGVPDRETLVAAVWVLRLAGDRLESQTRFALFRWTFDRSREWLRQAEQNDPKAIDPESGCHAFDYLELQLLHALSFPNLKGSRKSLHQVAAAWRKGLDSLTDGDGTPHGKWLSEIFGRFSQLAAATLFADSLNQSLWDKKSRSRQTGLLARSALLITPERVAFNSLGPREASRVLLTIADVLRLTARPGILELLTSWAKGTQRARSAAKGDAPRKLPKGSLQSDWAEWGCLRTSWSGEVDELVVHYDGSMPQMETIIQNMPLFAGAWSHVLKINGQPVTTKGEWTCCCWYVDAQAAFIELQLDREGPVQVIRQALLLRSESVLMMADSVRTPEAGQIEFSRQLPLVPGWSLEEDVLSREVALVQGETRVRVFPWTGPQMRIERSDETMSFGPQQIQIAVKTSGQCLYSGTIFDWSEKRREDPVDWTRVTVAEDGKIVRPDEAVGYRLRIGKRQWMLYHSHRAPRIPRTVLGVHTLSETVFARLTGQGETDAIVEVEL